jgi:hypothetical protein
LPDNGVRWHARLYPWLACTSTNSFTCSIFVCGSPVCIGCHPAPQPRRPVLKIKRQEPRDEPLTTATAALTTAIDAACACIAPTGRWTVSIAVNLYWGQLARLITACCVACRPAAPMLMLRRWRTATTWQPASHAARGYHGGWRDHQRRRPGRRLGTMKVARPAWLAGH